MLSVFKVDISHNSHTSVLFCFLFMAVQHTKWVQFPPRSPDSQRSSQCGFNTRPVTNQRSEHIQTLLTQNGARKSPRTIWPLLLSPCLSTVLTLAPPSLQLPILRTQTFVHKWLKETSTDNSDNRPTHGITASECFADKSSKQCGPTSNKVI